MLRRWLAHPLTRDVPIDDPRTTFLRRRIIREKLFLQQDLCRNGIGRLPRPFRRRPGRFLNWVRAPVSCENRFHALITSEVFCDCRTSTLCLTACLYLLRTVTLRAIVMVDVLHHIANVHETFLREATRCVRNSGAIVMIEPWVTHWSRLIYGKLHHEPFDPAAKQWEFPSSGPLSGANGALPWIVFERDRAKFEREFPDWQIGQIELQMPFRYLVSGGISMRTLSPERMFNVWRKIEHCLQPWMRSIAMFARIQLIRV